MSASHHTPHMVSVSCDPIPEADPTRYYAEYTSTSNFYGGVEFASTTDGAVYVFAAPENFVSISRAECYNARTAGTNTSTVTVQVQALAVGESATTGGWTNSTTFTTQHGTTDQLYQQDFTSIMTGIAAGDLITIHVFCSGAGNTNWYGPCQLDINQEYKP